MKNLMMKKVFVNALHPTLVHSYIEHYIVKISDQNLSDKDKFVFSNALLRSNYWVEDFAFFLFTTPYK